MTTAISGSRGPWCCGGRATLAALSVAFGACAIMGCQPPTAIRATSPDGRFVAVCRELPVLDGPDFELRLERPDGSLVRTLYQIGDGDPCHEVVWAPDGQVVAILTGHVARVRFVDVAWALAHPGVEARYWSWRQVDLSREGHPRIGRHLRFVGSREVQLELCEARSGGRLQGGPLTCSAPFVGDQFMIPTPSAITKSPQQANQRLHPKAAAGLVNGSRSCVGGRRG